MDRFFICKHTGQKVRINEVMISALGVMEKWMHWILTCPVPLIKLHKRYCARSIHSETPEGCLHKILHGQHENPPLSFFLLNQCAVSNNRPFIQHLADRTKHRATCTTLYRNEARLFLYTLLPDEFVREDAGRDEVQRITSLTILHLLIVALMLKYLIAVIIQWVMPSVSAGNLLSSYMRGPQIFSGFSPIVSKPTLSDN
ncbi:hypothetical protein CBL_10995 [Carabus blaptoides fortunei]